MKLIKFKPDFKDNRGSITDLFYSENINHVAHIKTVDTSSIRGNHYHKKTTQAMYMVKGSLNYWYKQLNEKKSKCVRVNTGEMVVTLPNEVHALTFDEENEFIVFSWGLRGGKDYELDTFRVDSIIKL
jgi:UDP-2-acetamido-2,6-beta-L-arabino-hexul-4-ose reductase